jgi:hypothetical protein
MFECWVKRVIVRESKSYRRWGVLRRWGEDRQVIPIWIRLFHSFRSLFWLFLEVCWWMYSAQKWLIPRSIEIFSDERCWGSKTGSLAIPGLGDVFGKECFSWSPRFQSTSFGPVGWSTFSKFMSVQSFLQRNIVVRQLTQWFFAFHLSHCRFEALSWMIATINKINRLSGSDSQFGTIRPRSWRRPVRVWFFRDTFRKKATIVDVRWSRKWE